MAAKKRARITLVETLSYSVGRYRFFKGKPQVTDDQELIAYLHTDPRFSVEVLEAEAPAKAKAPAPESKPVAKAAPVEVVADAEEKGDSEPEEVVAKPGLMKKAANAVKSFGKSAPPSKVARNDKKETAHEID